MMEAWTDIKDFEDRYQVSDRGRLRSLDREIVNPGSGGAYSLHGQLLKPRRDSDGYLMTDLWKAGRPTTVKVHRVVALAFLPAPEAGLVVDHINGQRDDNRLENLRWVTQSVNLYNRQIASGASGIVGVCFRRNRKNPWQAYISISGRFKSLGHFSSKEQAAAVRRRAVREICHAA